MGEEKVLTIIRKAFAKVDGAQDGEDDRDCEEDERSDGDGAEEGPAHEDRAVHYKVVSVSR